MALFCTTLWNDHGALVAFEERWKIPQNVTADARDILCDRCRGNTYIEGVGHLTAHWGQGSQHAGEQYEIHLCEPCFFAQLSALKRERWTQAMFTDEADEILRNDTFGLVTESGLPGKPEK